MFLHGVLGQICVFYLDVDLFSVQKEEILLLDEALQVHYVIPVTRPVRTCLVADFNASALSIPTYEQTQCGLIKSVDSRNRFIK